MDLGAFLGVVLTLFFGGLGIGYGGYSMQTAFPLLAFFSYMFGGGCIAASIVLAALRIERHQRDTTPRATGQPSLQEQPGLTLSNRSVVLFIRWLYQTTPSRDTDRINVFLLLSIKAGDRAISIVNWQVSIKWQSGSKRATTEVFRNEEIEDHDIDADIRWWQGTFYEKNLAWGKLALGPDEVIDGFLNFRFTDALQNKWAGRIEQIVIEATDISGEIYKVVKEFPDQ